MLTTERPQELPYIYLFTRKDLSVPQQIIQVAHAVDLMNSKYDSKIPVSNMVLVQVDNERALMYVAIHLEAAGIDFVRFEEPDTCYEGTAISTVPITDLRKREQMSRYQIMK